MRLFKLLAYSFFISLLMYGFSSCKVFYPNLMFKTSKKDLTPDSLITDTADAFLIKPGDILDFQIFSNKGFRLVDFGLEQQGGQQSMNSISVDYVVLQDSTVILPILGATKIAGYSREDAILYLEKLYSSIINDPLIFLKITNWRVYVFSGIGNAQAVPIDNINTSLLEILASFGGIPKTSKSFRIKIIRGELKDPVVRVIDLYKMNKLKLYDLNIQSNDIIYIEPVYRITSGILGEISPILSLISTFILIYSIANP
ncbi:MAG TPA: hypothetical protein EYQ86_04420 [Bacteroidetes bacterium]|nr:hypothetical protein [Bacteroidota bacterium]